MLWFLCAFQIELERVFTDPEAECLLKWTFIWPVVGEISGHNLTGMDPVLYQRLRKASKALQFHTKVVRFDRFYQSTSRSTSLQYQFRRFIEPSHSK